MRHQEARDPQPAAATSLARSGTLAERIEPGAHSAAADCRSRAATGAPDRARFCRSGPGDRFLVERHGAVPGRSDPPLLPAAPPRFHRRLELRREDHCRRTRLHQGTAPGRARARRSARGRHSRHRMDAQARPGKAAPTQAPARQSLRVARKEGTPGREGARRLRRVRHSGPVRRWLRA